MSDDVRPTAADLARDLRADLAVAEKATPGPWQADVAAGHVWHPDWLKRGWDRGIIATTDCDEDTDAIATSRVAWPATIRRALAAEAEVERLRRLIERDHTGLAAGLVKVLRAVRSWDWLRRIGEWGSYSYEQRTVSTMRLEVNGCLGEIEAAAEAALRRSGDLSRGVTVTDDDGEAD